MDNTDYIAIYAAIVATIVLLWDIYKWLWSARLRLTGRVSTNMMILDSMNPTGSEERYIVLNVENRGGIPCTVTNVVLAHYKTGIEWIRGKPSSNAVITHSNEFGYSLPYKLEPYGGEFRSKVLQTDELVDWGNDGYLYIGICHTMSKNTFWCRVPTFQVETSEDVSSS